MAVILTNYYPKYQMAISMVYNPLNDSRLEAYLRAGARMEIIDEDPEEILKATEYAEIVEDT